MRSKYYHIAICFLLAIPAISQTQVEVITKTVKDQFKYVSGYAIEVEGKSARISIQSWDKDEIGVEMKLISKGLTKEVAEKELTYQKYIIDEIDETYVIRNYLLLPAGLDKLKTVQETEIELHVPTKVELSVTNLFGNTRIKNLTGEIVLESEYGELVLDKISGNIRIESTFGDLFINDFDGTLTGDLEHTTSSINGYSGRAFVKSNLGDMSWTNIYDLTKLKITAEKSDVSLKFKDSDFDSYYWQLKTRFGEIDFPQHQSEERKIIHGDDKNPSIDISSDFGKITIEE